MKDLEMYIDGQFIENRSGKWINVLNPSTEEVISRMPDGTVDDVRAAIDAAEKAQGAWELLTSIERAQYLTKIAQGIRNREKELTDIIVREGGKTQGLANVEVNFTADYIDYMAGWARRYEGEIIPSDRPHETIFVFKKPIGVTTGILPWNFPFFLVARKAAPAMLTGNTIVLKPSQLTPENAYVFAQIVDEVGVPKGVFNIVNGRGSVVGHESRYGQPDRKCISRCTDNGSCFGQCDEGIAGVRRKGSGYRYAGCGSGSDREVDHCFPRDQYRTSVQLL